MTAGREHDPLELARNCVAVVVQASEAQERDPLAAIAGRAGKVGFDSAIVGACLAVVSIAGDVRELLQEHSDQMRYQSDQLRRMADALEVGELG